MIYLKNDAAFIQRQHGMSGAGIHLQHVTFFVRHLTPEHLTAVVKIQHQKATAQSKSGLKAFLIQGND
ncbi:hypothetical protein QE396_004616 [Enterobacter sp. SORGH_AS 287]|nr:hypothetical protein [Enterobacter sp. SORGH_AS_0287]